MTNTLPVEARDWFWDVAPETVDVVAQWNFVLDRILEYAGTETVRWPACTYGLTGLCEYFETRGGSVIVSENPHFWAGDVRIGRQSMHSEILRVNQPFAPAVLSWVERRQAFYRAGGTVAALHLGCRESEEFAFFRADGFLPEDLLEQLSTPPPIKLLQAERDMLTVLFHQVKSSFFGYPRGLIRPALNGPANFQIADVADIAPMKLAAIAGRGSRKDLVDLYCVCQQCFPLRAAMAYREAQFPSTRYDRYYLWSLSYFDDAETEPMDAPPDDLGRGETLFRSGGGRL